MKGLMLICELKYFCFSGFGCFVAVLCSPRAPLYYPILHISPLICGYLNIEPA